MSRRPGRRQHQRRHRQRGNERNDAQGNESRALFREGQGRGQERFFGGEDLPGRDRKIAGHGQEAEGQIMRRKPRKPILDGKIEPAKQLDDQHLGCPNCGIIFAVPPGFDPIVAASKTENLQQAVSGLTQRLTNQAEELKDAQSTKYELEGALRTIDRLERENARLTERTNVFHKMQCQLAAAKGQITRLKKNARPVVVPSTPVVRASTGWRIGMIRPLEVID